MDQRLKDNVRILTTGLGQIIRENEGETFFNKVEDIRNICKDLRKKPSPSKWTHLKKSLLGLSVPQAHAMARAFTLYFQMVNLAEETYRAHKIRSYEKDPKKPGPMSLGRLFHDFSKKRIPSSVIEDALSSLHIEPVLTAHPTEAKRKTILNHLTRIRRALDDLDHPDLTWRERSRLNQNILQTIEMLWQTKQVRDRSLRVKDEVEFVLHFFRQSIFFATSEFQDSFKKALEYFYPTVSYPKRPLRFGSWVGGDRDGNPLVTPESSTYALERHRTIILEMYKRKLNGLFGLLTSAKRFESVNVLLERSVNRDFHDLPELKKRFHHREPGEYYRVKVHAMWLKLDRTKTQRPHGYPDPDAFLSELNLLQKSLRGHHGNRTANGDLQKLIDDVYTFGFHLARLDFRQHSDKIKSAVKEMIGHWPSGHEWENHIKNPSVKLRVLSSSCKLVIREFRTLKNLQEQFGEEAADHFIFSMTQSEDLIWAALFLCRKTGLLTKDSKGNWRLNVDLVPLFETVEDLNRAPNIMSALWGSRFYRDLLKSRGSVQEVMLGYSDSNKTAGYLAANYELFRAERVLAQLAKQSRIQLRFFHGKGGSIDRGGGPAHRAVLAAPDSATGFQLRITEQGEVISHKYNHPVIAQRILEQMTSSVLMAGLYPVHELTEKRTSLYQETLSELANLSKEHYREFIYQTKNFDTYFSQAAPIDLIRRIQIASRPVYRSDKTQFKDLRAIPWVFSWTQNRHLVSAWYGMGTAFERYKQRHGRKGRRHLQKMYKDWSFFSSLVDNAQVSLAKTDLMVAQLYSTLVENPSLRKIMLEKMVREYRLTLKNVLEISRKKRLLHGSAVLKESLALRNPYLDPLHALQVEYLRLWRRGAWPSKAKQHEALLVLLMTINGIAFGMKSTG